MEKEKILWIDYLRVLATVSVVFLHTSIPLLDKFEPTGITYSSWWTGNIYDSAVRFCVPVFIMISGALLLNTEMPIGAFFRRRFTRILFPFLFWNLIYIFLLYDRKAHSGVWETICWAYTLLRQDNVSYHLWFTYVLIGLYLFVPILGKWIKHAEEKEIWLFLSVWAFTMLTRYPFLRFLGSSIYLANFYGYAGYLVLGYYLSTKKFPCRNMIYLSLALITGGIALTILGYYYATKEHLPNNDLYYEYLTINVAIAASGVFLLFKNIRFKQKTNLWHRLLMSISRFSFGIYLVHIIVLNYLNNFGMSCYSITPGLGTPLIAILCLLVSLVIVWLISKLPFGKYISG